MNTSKKTESEKNRILVNIINNDLNNIKKNINGFYDHAIYKDNPEKIRNEVISILKLLNLGIIRVCQKSNENWTTNDWIKKAILMHFYISSNKLHHNENCGCEEEQKHCNLFTCEENCIQCVTNNTPLPYSHFHSHNDSYSRYSDNSFDKIRLKTHNWSQSDFEEAGFRMVHGAIIRYASFIEKNSIIMPSFINIGSYIGSGTMIDTWASVGSCAQIGSNCHVSAGAVIGGVLEPVQANPVIIEDNCFIGANSSIVEGVIVSEGAVISTGLHIGASTKIIDRETGEIYLGKIPPYSVVVPGVMPSTNHNKPSLSCAVIVKKVDKITRLKTEINEILRSSE